MAGWGPPAAPARDAPGTVKAAPRRPRDSGEEGVASPRAGGTSPPHSPALTVFSGTGRPPPTSSRRDGSFLPSSQTPWRPGGPGASQVSPVAGRGLGSGGVAPPAGAPAD